MRKLTGWDRFLISVAPGYGIRRARALAVAAAYEAAGGGRRTTNWPRRNPDANSAVAGSSERLRALSRDLRRNNSWARRGIQVISNNTVGAGIQARTNAESESVKADAAAVWRDWSRSLSCDWDGRLPFTGLQRLIMSTVVESGGALIVREPANSSDGLPVPIRIRVLEADYLDDSRDRAKGQAQNAIQYGIELDGRGRRVAYWIHQTSPGESLLYSEPSKRVPADRVIHVYQSERPGQLRGAPWLASVIAKLQDFDDFDDARLMQQKIAACFGAFVTDPDGDSSNIGTPDDDEPDRLENMEPGTIEYLPGGKEINFAMPPTTNDHGGYTSTQLRRIATGMGVTYEDLTGDYSQVNFSSARMARLSHWANVYGWRWDMLIPHACDGVYAWVMEMAAAMRGWGEVPTARWSPPPMPMLDPEAEGLAMARLIRAGGKTLYQVIREQGQDPSEHLAEIAEANAALDELGIVLDSDARKTSAAGVFQSDNGARVDTPPGA
jgi:lambda family phage portal protein